MELSHKLAKVRPNSSVERVALSGGQGSPERSAGAGPGFDPRLGLFFCMSTCLTKCSCIKLYTPCHKHHEPTNDLPR